MNYGSCDNCKKVIRYDKLRLCEDCKNKFLHAVKDYIYDNGIKDVKEIHDATGVPIRVIEFFLNNDYFTSVNLVSDDEAKKVKDEQMLQQMALLEALKDSFNGDKKVVKEETKEAEMKGEMHFLGRRGK